MCLTEQFAEQRRLACAFGFCENGAQVGADRPHGQTKVTRYVIDAPTRLERKTTAVSLGVSPNDAVKEALLQLGA